jgi:hypothetical protein
MWAPALRSWAVSSAMFWACSFCALLCMMLALAMLVFSAFCIDARNSETSVSYSIYNLG